MLRRILRWFGFVSFDYGFACGRHWIEIDGMVIAQTAGDDVWLRDEDVHALGYALFDRGEHWDASVWWPDGTKRRIKHDHLGMPKSDGGTW